MSRADFDSNQMTMFGVAPIGLSTVRRSQYKKSVAKEVTPQCSVPFAIIPVCHIHPRGITVSTHVEWLQSRKVHDRFSTLRGKSNAHTNEMSDNTKRKMSRALEYLLFFANDKVLPTKAHGKQYHFKIAFITLTLPSLQRHADREIKSKCLDSFLTEIRKCYHVKNYVWRAEKQKNGNIHFHIVLDQFIPHWAIRQRWNRIIDRLGYVQKFAEKHQHVNPNSTDVHSLKHVNNAQSYLMKYASKTEKNGEIEGRVWGCSESLSNLKGGQVVIDSSINEEISKIAAHKKCRSYHGDYFTVHELDLQTLNALGCFQLIEAFGTFAFEHFGNNIQLNFQTG